MKKKMQLYVWQGFCPDYTDGLAFAIASSVEEAQQKIIEYREFDVYEWGILTIHPLDEPFAACVSGGG